MEFAEWIQQQRDAGNCPVRLDTLTDDWPDFPLDYLMGSINRDHTVACDELLRVARYADDIGSHEAEIQSSVDKVQTADSRTVKVGYGDTHNGCYRRERHDYNNR